MLDVSAVVLQSIREELDHLIHVHDVRIVLDEVLRKVVQFLDQFCNAFFVCRVGIVVILVFSDVRMVNVYFSVFLAVRRKLLY